MRKRLLELPLKRSFFLFGARNTGKSTLVKSRFPKNQTFIIDLLHSEQESRYLKNPSLLREEVLALPETISHIIIDEVQKIPALLDEVHSLIESTDKVFILTAGYHLFLQYVFKLNAFVKAICIFKKLSTLLTVLDLRTIIYGPQLQD